jgi:hypothetical protein
MEYLKLFSSHTDYEDYASGGTMVRPNVSYCEDVKDVHYNPWTWAEQYLTFVALEDGTISFDIFQTMGTDMITSISYSTDDGETWTTTQNQNGKTSNLVITVNVNEGDKVLWKGDAQQLGDEDENCASFFSSTCEFDVMGNVMSLLYGDSFKGKTTIEANGCFVGLFCPVLFGEKTCNVVNAKNLVLPATTLTMACYGGMFYDCTGLTSTPELPATTLAEGCYNSMFYGCTGLTSTPELPATTLAKNCYAAMFYGCTSLTSAPTLPATTLAEGCYNSMFYGCTGLTSTPELPATTLAESCYEGMFYGCTSLTSAPTLPATTLADRCYGGMFYGCTNLNYIKAMFTTTPSTTYTQSWVSGVAASGTFVKNSAATWDVSGVNGIPNGWTVETASE